MKGSLRLFLLLLCLVTQQGWSFFPVIYEDTLTITLSVHVSGNVKLYPYAIRPDGELVWGKPETVSDATGHHLSPITFTNPVQGVYAMGVGIVASRNSTVSIDADGTTIDSVQFNDVSLCPTNPNVWSVSPKTGQTTYLCVYGPYFQMPTS
jgi:hypothetical protein